MDYIHEYTLKYGYLPTVLYWTFEEHNEGWLCNECVWYPLGWSE